MAFLQNNSSSGINVSAVLTRSGQLSLFKNGTLSVSQFALLDPEINYQLLNVVNTDQDSSDILAEAITEASSNDNSGEYSSSFLLNNPYYVQNSIVLAGNTIQENPFYAPNQIVVPFSSLSGDTTSIFPPASSTSGTLVNTNAFYNITVIAVDNNGSSLNGTVISLYENGALYASTTLNDNSQYIFSNLSSNQSYKVGVTNPNYQFSRSGSGGPFWQTTSLTYNQAIKFIATAATFTSGSLILSGTVVNGISSAPVSALTINLHYANTTVSAATNISGVYSFGSLSSNIQYLLAVNNNSYYIDPSVVLTGVLTATTTQNITVFPTSVISGKVYYSGTTKPISNAVISLYSGTSGAYTNNYLASVASDINGAWNFPNVLLLKNYNIQIALQNYTFPGTPINFTSPSMTASQTGVIIYGQNNPGPVIFDSPFPLRRRNIVEDISELPAFYDPCSWILCNEKIATLNYNATFNYSPILHSQVLQSSNYLDLIDTISGPYTFSWNSQQTYTDSFGNISTTQYVSDNYTININLYAFPYQFTLPGNTPQWDETSLNDQQVAFPQQVNGNAANVALKNGDSVQYINLIPDLSNQQLVVNLEDVNQLQALLPQTQTILPLQINTSNAVPALGLLKAFGFSIDQNALKVTITPDGLAQNPNFTQYAVVQGADQVIPIETIVDSFQNVSVNAIQNVTNTQTYTISTGLLPIFIDSEPTRQTTFLSNNLKTSYGFTDLLNLIRTSGFIFNNIVSWSVDSTGNYAPGRQSAYLTINTFGTVGTLTQMLFTPNGNNYTVSSEFNQFLISYFDIISTDTVTINQLLNNNALIDWIFYIIIVQFGIYKHAYTTGNLQSLMNISSQARYALLLDLIGSGKSVVDIVNDIIARQGQPSTVANTYLQSVAGSNVTPISTAQAVAAQTSQIKTTAAGIVPTLAAAGTLQNGNIVAPSNIVQAGNNMAAPITPSNAQFGNTTQSLYGVLLGQYTTLTQFLLNSWNQNLQNVAIQELYGILKFDYKISFVIIIVTLGTQVVTNTIQQPIQTLQVVTQTITPILTQSFNITNANNYFNLNSGIQNKITLTIEFDITQPECVNDFLQAINFLLNKLYVLYLGIEIIDNGIITSNLNANVKVLPQYINAPIAVQNAFCLNDKAQWFIPLTIGGISQTTSNIALGDPINFVGQGYIKLVPFTDGSNNAYLIRIIDLTNTGQSNNTLVNNLQLTGSDYLAFDVMLVSNYKTADFTKILRFMQILSNYTYNLMTADLNNLRVILQNQYKNIAGFTYLGSFGPGFGSSTVGPNFWSNTYISWTQGMTPIAMLQQLFGQATTIPNIGTVITDLSQFITVAPIPVLNSQVATPPPTQTTAS